MAALLSIQRTLDRNSGATTGGIKEETRQDEAMGHVLWTGWSGDSRALRELARRKCCWIDRSLAADLTARRTAWVSKTVMFVPVLVLWSTNVFSVIPRVSLFSEKRG